MNLHFKEQSSLFWTSRFQNKYRGTKQLVSVNTCSVEGNSAYIFASKVFAWNSRSKKKINAYYFREDETAVLGAIKAQLPFSEGKYQLPNS